jgi:hypothetical protein
MWAIIDKVVSSSSVSAKFSGFLNLPKTAIRKQLIGTQYTITDPSVSAGENFKGHVDRLRLTADKMQVYDIQTDELDRVTELCSAVKAEKHRMGGVSSTPATAFYSDATPTTAELQRAWYILDLPHDFRLYKSTPKLEIKMQAATAEWGTATAYSGYIFLAYEAGNVEESAYVFRVPDGTSTTHDLPMGDDLVTGLLITGPAANTFKRVQVKSINDDDEYDSDEPIVAQAIYNLATAQVPADDDVDFQLLVGFASVPYDGRELHVELTTTGTTVAFFYNVKATHKIPDDAPVTEVSKGVARASTSIQTTQPQNAPNTALRLAPSMFGPTTRRR